MKIYSQPISNNKTTKFETVYGFFLILWWAKLPRNWGYFAFAYKTRSYEAYVPTEGYFAFPKCFQKRA